MIGKTVSHYRIVERLGSGGMGVVYKATDTRLGRSVALKFLPSELARDPETLMRFQREVRTASALNHPHICTIYDIGEFEGQPFIAMELLDGQSLKELLAGGPLAIPQLVNIGLQISGALQATHAKGVVHRDIKPANVLVSPQGHAKLLDFGLAKPIVPRSIEDVPADMHTLAAVDLQLTTPGLLVGTVTYMSPEQAQGLEVDSRTDLFSLGLVLYEMAAGRPAFQGHSLGDVLHGILARAPQPPRQINPGVPAQLEEVISKALAKDRGARYQSASDLHADLTRLKRELDYSEFRLTTQLQSPLYRRMSLRAALLMAMLVMGVIGVVSWRLVSQRQLSLERASLQNATFTQITAQSGLEMFPSLSPDGRSLVYASPASGNWDIYLQRIGGQNPTNLTKDSPADDSQPAFNPDGNSIAFRSERDGGGIYVMGATGESAHRISDFGFNPAWSPDGKRVVIATEGVEDSPNDRMGPSSLWTVDVMKGESQKIVDGDAVQPHWSPNGHRIAYWAAPGGRRDVWTVRPDGTGPVAVTGDDALDWNPVWAPDGKYLYFASDRGGNHNLWRVAIDEQTGQLLGNPVPVTTGGGSAQRQHASLSADGKHIAYVEENVISDNMHRVAWDPATETVVGASQPISQSLRPERNPDLSPDGTSIAYFSWDRQEDIFVIRPDGTGNRQITNDVHKDRVPRWSPDGRSIAFWSNRSGNFEAWLISPDGSGLQQLTDHRTHGLRRAVWSADSKHLAIFCVGFGPSIIEVGKLSKDHSGALPPLPEATEQFDVWSWSPDGKWIAGTRREESTYAIKGISLYSVENRTYEHLTDFGWLPVWFKGSQRLVFENRGRLHIVDRTTKKVRELLSLPPHFIHAVAQIPSNNNFLYFGLLSREADVWFLSIP